MEDEPGSQENKLENKRVGIKGYFKGKNPRAESRSRRRGPDRC